MKNAQGFLFVVSFLFVVLAASGCGTIDCWTCRFDATVQPADTAVPTDVRADVPETDVAVPTEATPATDASPDAAPADAACTPGAVEWDCAPDLTGWCGPRATSRVCGPNRQWSVCLIDPRCFNRDGGSTDGSSADVASADVTSTDVTPSNDGAVTPPADTGTVSSTDEYVVMAATDGEPANEVHLEQWVAGIGDSMPVGSHANVGDLPGRTTPLVSHVATFRINRCSDPQFQGRFVFAAVSPSRRQTTLWSCMRFFRENDGRFEQYGSFSVRRNGALVTFDPVDNGVRGCNYRPRRDSTCP